MTRVPKEEAEYNGGEELLNPLPMTEPFEQNLDRAAFSALFQFERELGRGAFGEVFLARQLSLDRLVAVKIIGGDGDRDPSSPEAARFAREARILARLSHPNILRIFDAGMLEGLPFLVVEYVDARDLAVRLKQETKLRLSEAARIGQAIAEGLDYLHGEKIVHRDLKPANVLLGGDGAVKVSDFGIARPLDAKRLTHAGTLLGTPYYMAPESIDSNEATSACDIYALGVLLFETLHGHLPFEETDSLQDIFRSKLSALPEAPSQALPAPVAALVTQCLKRDPDERPSAREVADTLARFTSEAGAATLQGAPSPGLATHLSGSSSNFPAHAGPGNRTIAVAGPGRPARPVAVPRIPVTPAPQASRRHLPALLAAVVLLGMAIAWRTGRFEPASRPIEPPPAPSVPLPVPPPVPVSPPRRKEPDLTPMRRLSQRLRQEKMINQIRYMTQAEELSSIASRSWLSSGLGLVMEQAGALEPGFVPASEAPGLLLPLLEMRSMMGRLLLYDLVPPANLSNVAKRVYPMVLGLPPGRTARLWAAPGLPMKVALGPREPIDFIIRSWPYSKIPFEPTALPENPNRRVWWVADIKDFALRYLLDLRLVTKDGVRVFPLVPASDVATLAGPNWFTIREGLVTVGFDSRLLQGYTGILELSFMPLRGSADQLPELRKLELRESIE